MIVLISNNNKKTNLIINVKLGIQKRFYPRNSLTGILCLRNNTFFNNINTLIPKPCSSMASFTSPRSITKIFPKIENNTFILKTSSYHFINRDHLIQNKKLDDDLTKLKITIKEKNTQKPFSDKPITLKTINNKEYETNLTINTKVNDISDEELITELKKRELVKEDPGNTVVNIKLQDDSNYLLGSSKHGIKLSTLGQAYIEKFINTNTENINIKNSNIIIENSNFIIIIPPESDSNMFIESGKQKHMLVVIDENNNYFALGYLTSKISRILLSDKQLKIFQQQKENIQSTTKDKNQFLLSFENFLKIEENDIKRVKWDNEYIKNLSKESRDRLEDICKILKEQKCIFNFNKKGITKEDCLKICIEHDKIAQQKDTKHPLTLDQIRKNEVNKEKQKNKSNKELQGNSDVKSD